MENKKHMSEAVKIIRALALGLHEAMKIFEELEDKKELEQVEKILENLKSDIERFFSDHIDRRSEKRDKSLYEDLVAYFTILGSDDRFVD